MTFLALNEANAGNYFFKVGAHGRLEQRANLRVQLAFLKPRDEEVELVSLGNTLGRPASLLSHKYIA